MLNKVKNYYKKILKKISELKIISLLLPVAFCEIFFGAMSIMITNNLIVKILATVVLLTGCVLCAGIIVIAGMNKLIYIVKKVRHSSQEKNFSLKSEIKRTRNIEKNNKDNKKIRVAFYCDGGQFWSTYSDVYEYMLEDSRFEPIVVAAPEMLYDEIYHYDAIKFLDDKNIPYIKAYDNGKWLNFKNIKADYFFYNRHYLIRQSKKSSFMEARKYSRICYVPYALCPQVGKVEQTLCRFSDLRAFDYLFSENSVMTEIYNKYKNEYDNVITKIENVGSPKFAYALAHANKEACHDKKYVQSVLYTPRWCFNEGTSSFFQLKEYFFDLARNNKDIEYIFRPHPLMKQTIVKELGKKFWDDFISTFEQYENAYVDFETDYMESFSKASVLVSDLSTMMFEFSVTEKPVIYMYQMDKFNSFGKEASKGYYYCSTAEAVDNTLKKLRKGNDVLAETRKKVSQKLYCNDGLDPSKKICNILLEQN